MATEHRNIPDSERHEVKGSSTAPANFVLKADGDGTTSFVSPSTLRNITIGNTIEGKSFSNQNPLWTDDPLQVTWGSAISNSDVDIDANGEVTILSDGLYFITYTLNIGRTGNTGVATIFSRLTINGSEIGITSLNEIDEDSSSRTSSVSVLRSLSENDIIRVQILRDSGGANDGGLVSIDPTIVSWEQSPSASICLQKIAGGY